MVYFEHVHHSITFSLRCCLSNFVWIGLELVMLLCPSLQQLGLGQFLIIFSDYFIILLIFCLHFYNDWWSVEMFNHFSEFYFFLFCLFLFMVYVYVYIYTYTYIHILELCHSSEYPFYHYEISFHISDKTSSLEACIFEICIILSTYLWLMIMLYINF
jgi:hypothetical protein